MRKRALWVATLVIGCAGEQVTPTLGTDAALADTGAPSVDALTDTTSGACGDHPGPRMVQLVTSKGKLCIDTTEVSNADYAKFAAVATLAELPPYCKFKTAYSVTNPLPAAKDFARGPANACVGEWPAATW